MAAQRQVQIMKMDGGNATKTHLKMHLEGTQKKSIPIQGLMLLAVDDNSQFNDGDDEIKKQPKLESYSQPQQWQNIMGEWNMDGEIIYYQIWSDIQPQWDVWFSYLLATFVEDQLTQQLTYPASKAERLRESQIKTWFEFLDNFCIIFKAEI